MKTINNVNYYSKKEIADIVGCAFATVSVRISKLGLKGYYLGRSKYFTEDEVKIIAEYRHPSTTKKQ